MAKLTKLTSIGTLVESPFIIASINGNTFGTYGAQQFGSTVKVTYPNFMESLQITKVNGTVNTYILKLIYQVRAGDDPNLVDRILSSAAGNRQIILYYGDWNAPAFIYKEEKCIITNVTSSLNMSSSSITYMIKCTSDAIGLTSTTFNFPPVFDKPSNVLKNLFASKKYGFRDAFPGMMDSLDQLIASTDKEVQLLAQKDVTPFAYANYLVSSMINANTTGNSAISNSFYTFTINDDRQSDYGGAYFKVTEVTANTRTMSTIDTYEVDVNYPGDNYVTQFSLSNEQSYSILYESAESLQQEEYTYSVDDKGNLVSEYAPAFVRSASNGLSAAKSSWWTRMTQFPIEAQLTIKGLTRPAMLMSYVKVNVWFAGGNKHTSSGLYIITKQVDTLDSTGYKTTLTLLRVGGDQ